jgi:hypothetical protein
MFKNVIRISIFLISAVIINAQNASDYFPSVPGKVWRFITTPLDSLNNPVNDLAVTTIDSFAAKGNYFGREANFILSKTGTESTVNFLPFTDSSYVSTNGSVASQYLSFGSFLDSIGGTNLSFLTFLNSLTDWYDVYRLDAAVNDEYSLFRIDTTVTIDSQDYPIRFEVLVKRLNDENISTAIGNFTAKKFDVITKLSLIVTIFPFPPVAIPILELPSTNWIAPGNWIVKNYRESITVDLSLFSGPSFYIPGSQTTLQQPVTLVEEETEPPVAFELFQNYPNPFNPSTKIEFLVAHGKTGYATPLQLKIYDILGNEIATLVDKKKSPGIYEVEFNASGLSSGVYFYELKSFGQTQTKKMILSK